MPECKKCGKPYSHWTAEIGSHLCRECRAASSNLAPPDGRDERVICQAKGRNGRVVLFESHVRIERRGFTALMTQGLKGDKDILLTSITSVQFKPVGSLTAGYIQFSYMGGLESKQGLFQAVEDENSVMFTETQEPEFRTLKRTMEEMIARPATQPAITPAYLDELEKLADLRSRGIITEEEFNSKKKQLLGLGNDG